MKVNFKKGNYFMYRSNNIDNYWIVGKVTNITFRGLTKYYRYEVVKRSDFKIFGDAIGGTSFFMHGSVFHGECVKMDGVDDSSVLAMIL